MHFVAGRECYFFLLPSFWEDPAWKKLCGEIGRKDSRPHLQKVALELEFDRLAEEEQPYAKSRITKFVADAAPDIDVVVLFAPEAQAAPAE